MIPFIYNVSVIYNRFINDHAAAFTVIKKKKAHIMLT